MLTRLRSIWTPAMYHGHGQRRNYFEGWYYKFVDATGRHVHAVIPGIFLGKDASTSHCFVQVLDGATGHSTYHRYPAERFWASEHELDLRVGPNRFYLDRIQLDIDDADRSLRGELGFEGVTPWPVTLASPGVMGPYAFAPFMECYHGVLSFDHAVRGALIMNGAAISFDGGRGYMEKDWGQAFPQAWVWGQSNHFDQVGTSITLSVATIPWLGASFRGFIIGFWHERRLYRFATYTGAEITTLKLSDTHLVLRVEDKRHRLEVDAARSEGGLLHAPYRIDMLQRVTESLTAGITVQLIDQAGGVIFRGVGRHAGLEINGEIQQIVA